MPVADAETDIVIIGGGSAGCVVAARLSEDPTLNVTLLEAGTAGPSFLYDIPGMTKLLMGNPKFDWMHWADPDPTLNGRKLIWHAGKMAGGGSAINGMVYIRGRGDDFDGWAASGCTGWGWDDVTPYYRRAEHYLGERQNGALGTSGPQSVSPMQSVLSLTDRFIEASMGLGFDRLDDHNEGTGEGVYYTLASQRRGRRVSTARSYLLPARARPNLRVVQGVLVDRILFDQGRVAAVRYLQGDTVRTIRVRREVIVSAGTLQSPTILMRSGIGPAGTLGAAGVDVQVDAAEVGANLQEHIGFNIPKFVSVPTYNSEMNLRHGIKHVIRYFRKHDGPLASPSVQAMGWIRTSPELAKPDLQLSWLPFAMDAEAVPPAMHSRPSVALGGVITQPHARGRVSLRDASPTSPPKIAFQLFEDERDLQTLIRATRIVEKIYAAEPLASFVTGPAAPFRPDMSDDEIAGALRAHSRTGLHCVGTCRMGSDPQSVVDPELRVRGVEGLRVIDASIMPRQISANTNATAIMIGEKGAEMIRRA